MHRKSALLVRAPPPPPPKTSWSPARHWAMIWGGHEPRVYAAVCFWLRRGSGGHQLCRAGVSVGAAAGSLLCLHRRLTCPAFLTLLTQTQQVQPLYVCVFLFLVRRCVKLIYLRLCSRCQFVAVQSQCCCHVGVIQSDSMRLH